MAATVSCSCSAPSNIAVIKVRPLHLFCVLRLLCECISVLRQNFWPICSGPKKRAQSRGFPTHCAHRAPPCAQYWGKRDLRMNTPINSSVSVTMNQDDLRAITTVVASPAFTADRLWLNGQCVVGRTASRAFSSAAHRVLPSQPPQGGGHNAQRSRADGAARDPHACGVACRV